MGIFETKEEKNRRYVQEAHELGQENGSKRMGLWEDFNAKPLYELDPFTDSETSKAESEAYDVGLENARKQRK